MRILYIQHAIFAQSTMLLTHKRAPPRAACIRPENPVEQLQTLRKELRALKRKRKRLDITTTWTPIQRMKRLGVLIHRLTNDPKWTIIYVKSWQARNFQRTLCLPGAITDVTVQAWSHALRDDTELETMMTDLAHPGRMRVDRFLMESIVRGHRAAIRKGDNSAEQHWLRNTCEHGHYGLDVPRLMLT